MSSEECVDKDFDDLICVNNDQYMYLDSEDNWLTSDPKTVYPQKETNCNDIREWIGNAFWRERSRGSHMILVNKLDELNVLSPQSVDSRTFTRQKQRQKRQSLFNSSNLSTLCSPVNEDEYFSPDQNDRTFEVHTNRKSLNGTFSKAIPNNTFTLTNDADIDDVEKIAKLQEDSLRQSCSNGWSSQQLSPKRSQMTNINTNTLTKSRDPERRLKITEVLMNDLTLNHFNINDEENDVQCYQNGLSPDDFKPNVTYNTSTPLTTNAYRNANYNQNFGEHIVSKIMPNVSNLRANSSYSRSKVGRSEPNLSRRLQPMTRGTGHSTNASHFGSKTTENYLNRNLLESKTPSDSRLLVRNPLKYQNMNQFQGVGRITSPPPPSQSQLLLNRNVAVEGELNRMGTNTINTTTTATNLCRKSTFRVRDYSSERNGIDLCLTNNTIASTNGTQTNKSNNNCVQRNGSKIPGPKPIRSGIPVCGQRTAIPCPISNRQTVNPTDNSWKTGCF